jgi:hypothetical protein
MKYLLAILVSVAPVAAAQSDQPLSDEAMARAEETPLALDPVEVTGQGWSYDQEVTLRLIRGALDRSKSQRQEDRDVLICWIDESVGSHFNYLGCARNGDLWALERPNGAGGPTVPMGGYGKIMRSERPVNRYKLEQALASLPGSEEFDQEFLQMAVAGDRPPRDIPDEEEAEQFARAYKSVGRLARRGASEDRQIRAIQDEGLSLARYNRIADLIETYQSVENDIAERLASLN